MTSKLVLVVCFLAVGGCAQPSERTDGEPAQQAEPVRTEATEAAEESLLPVGTPARDSVRDRWVESAFLPTNATRASVVAAFGEPDSLVTVTRPNQHDTTAVDTIHRVVYNRGLRVWVYQGNGGREFLTYAEVSGRGFLRDTTIEVGMRWDAVLEKLGPPLGEFLGNPYYDSLRRDGADEPVIFEIVDRVVEKINFQYYTG